MKESRWIILFLSVTVAFFVVAVASPVFADAPTYAPDSLTVTAVSTTQVNLVWTSVAGASSYQIDRETPVGGGFTTIQPGHGPLSYSDTGLTPGTTYNYRVAAVNASGTSPFSDRATSYVTTLGAAAVTGVPSTPTALKAVGIAGGMTLTWTAPASGAMVTGYKIEREVGGGFSVLVPDTGSTGTSYSDSGLSLGATYGYQVTALSASGPSNPSPRAYGTVPMPPNAPPTASAVAGDGTATVNWFSASGWSGGVTGYKVTWVDGNASASVSVGNVASTTVTGLMNGTRYYFLVRGVNAAGDGFAAQTNTVTPVAVPQVPSSTPALAPTPALSPAPTPAPASSSPATISAQSLQVQLNALLAQLQALQLKAQSSGTVTPSSPTSSPPAAKPVGSSTTFSRDLDLGSRGIDVKALQEFLIEQNKGPVAEQLAAVGATGYFGPLTRKALAEYQGSVGIAPAAGYFGPKTRSYINAKNF
ncbi:MAG: hypothetical protein A2945_03455 [Candidatus Liptonbacteria bacterium RIFCSPLOWO2_01_FULL_52_25]|uniref:Fibronectin type-III domain-containing protein n=1 Tax=Candidatus Liptonbacteria bacterium RIFCSPLOWO2_01_FULL_52_25 TaxID=1798650 RepID=A0A1G2CGM2_9BACT|nr:MAG: hypothetical protein A2945_03455 [Candidatus Liptonbacteria bacterium RIFCSPLOWO2_01_FULL_52_25]